MADEARPFAGSGWLNDFSARAAEFAQESAETNARLAKKWSERSLDPSDDWTVDTVTADLIEVWEYWTPLMGEFLDLGLEAFQYAIRPNVWER